MELLLAIQKEMKAKMDSSLEVMKASQENVIAKIKAHREEGRP